MVKIFPSGKDQTARSSDGPSDVPDLSVCHTSRHSHGHRHWFLLVAIVICLPIFVWHPLATLDTSFWGEVRTWHLILRLASPMSSLSAGCHITIGTIIASFSWHRQLHVEVQQLNKGLFRAPLPPSLQFVYCHTFDVIQIMIFMTFTSIVIFVNHLMRQSIFSLHLTGNNWNEFKCIIFLYSQYWTVMHFCTLHCKMRAPCL